MTNQKTPLELINDINKHCLELFELRRVSKALLTAATLDDDEVSRTIIRSLENTTVNLANHVSDIYWDNADLKRIVEEDVLEKTKDHDDIEEDLPFVIPSEEVEA